MKRAQSYEDLKPLIELCKTGKLFDVQAWIAAGKPVNPPVPTEKKPRPRSPLQYAIKTGFHSLVQVLLEGGAEIECTEKYSALNHALYDGHYESAKLLVEHGANVKAVDLSAVFHSWQPEIMAYFIEHGADMETGNPLARAFLSRIRTAVTFFQQYKDRVPSFQEQANIALRYYCATGNPRWASLLLWAGADPFARGPSRPEDEPDPESDTNAVEKAAVCEQFAILRMKRMRVVPTQEQAHATIRMVCEGGRAESLRLLMETGYPVNDQENGGSSHIETLLIGMVCWTRGKEAVDTAGTRDRMKMIDLLVCHGARWIPGDPARMDLIRRTLLKLIPYYAIELICLMGKYQACERAVIERLLKGSALRAHVALGWDRVLEALERLPEGNLPAKPKT